MSKFLKRYGKEKEKYIHIQTAKEMSKYINPIYILEDYMKEKSKYKELKEYMYYLLKCSYEHYNCRSYPVKFKFYMTDEVSRVLELRHFAVLLMLLHPLCNIRDVRDIMDESFIPDFYENGLTDLNDYINNKLIQTIMDNHVSTAKMNRSIATLLYDLTIISDDFSLILGVNFSFKTFSDLYTQHPRIREIMETSFDDSMKPNEIEDIINSRGNELMALIKEIPENDLAICLRAKGGLKPKQLWEYMIANGMKPDIEGTIIPKPISNSTLIGGTNTPSYMFVDACAARKSLIMNHNIMGKAGYYGKKSLLLARTLEMSRSVSDCRTKHLVKYHVTNQTFLNKLHGKFYRMTDNPGEHLKSINSMRDKHLIGQDIYVRSIATCALGDHVCQICVGKTSQLNLDIAEGYAGFEIQEVTKVINQNILSAKHLLTTKSELIEFNPEFYNFFTLTTSEICLNKSQADVTGDIEDYALYIRPGDIKVADEFDDATVYSTFIETGEFLVVNKKTGETIEMKPKEAKNLYVKQEMIDLMKSSEGYINFKDLENDDVIFNIIINNNELTKPLYDFMELTDKENPGLYLSIDEFAQKLTELMIESEIGASINAAEILLNRMLRSVNENGEPTFDRPSFYNRELEPYRILTISKCLEYNKSIHVGMASARLRNQLLSNDIGERSHVGYLAPLYSTTVDNYPLFESGYVDDDED